MDTERDPGLPGSRGPVPPEAPPTDIDLVRDLPGIARVAATSYLRALTWSVGTGLNAGATAVIRALEGDSTAAIVTDAAAEVRGYAARLLGLAQPRPLPVSRSVPTGSSTAQLRERAAQLLARSADVNEVDDVHPAYDRILDEMSPDEARVLRFLAYNGAQPAVDVRTNRPLGVGSELIASGLSMIGEHAGCRNVDRTNAYLNNLFRLGLVWFSRESLDPQRYQLIEAQPKVQEAMARAGRAPRTVHRSVHLTPFGLDFATTCLPLDATRAIEPAALDQPPAPNPSL